MSVSNNDVRKFIQSLHMYIPDSRDIGPLKIVATPQSETIVKNVESTNSIIARLWNALLDEEKQAVNQRFLNYKKFTLGVHIARDANVANHIIVYAKEYLDILAIAADKTPDEILTIIEKRDDKTQEELDIIQVAFGDKYKREDVSIVLSPSGNALEQIYLELLETV